MAQQRKRDNAMPTFGVRVEPALKQQYSDAATAEAIAASDVARAALELVANNVATLAEVAHLERLRLEQLCIVADV